MEKNGYIVSADGDTVKIRIDRDSACGGNCAHCHGCSSEMIIEYKNCCDFKEGEIVKVTMDTKRFFKKAFLGYGLLVIAMIFGGILGYSLFKSEAISAIFALVFLAFILMMLKKVQKEDREEIKVERILD